MLKKYLLLFIICITIYFFHAVVTKQGLYGDGNGYYIYTQSIYFDRELNSPKVYRYLSNFNGAKYIFSRIFWNPLQNPFSIGTGLLWLPSMAFVNSVNSILHLGIERFDLIYELGPGISGVLMMLGGLYFLEKYLLNYYNKNIVFLTIITLFFTTNVFYYSTLEPALSHQPSFFIICFLIYWSNIFKKSNLNYFYLGLIIGFMAITRIVDTFLLIPLIISTKPKVKNLFIILIGILISITPQLINQLIQNGNAFTNLYLNGSNGSWNISFTHFIEFLTSPKRGLFLWSPILLIGFWGLIKSNSKAFITTLIFFWLITSSWSAYLSAGFGQRLAFSTIPFFGLGLAHIFNRLKIKSIILIFVIFSFWNMLLIKNIYLHKDLFIQNDNFTINQFTKYMIRLN